MKPDLLPLEQAVALVIEAASVLDAETIPLARAAGRTLRADILAPFDLPPESASLMDGYAVRVADLLPGTTLNVGMVVPAGRAPERGLRAGECARIFTGGVLPDGADAVVKQEDVDAADATVRFGSAVAVGDHVRRSGSDAVQGERLLSAGTELDGGARSLIASLGLARVSVTRQPVVAILATGDELQQPGETRRPGAVYESNTVGLGTQAQEAGAMPLVLEAAPDNAELIAARLRATPADIYVTSGGASVGDYDFARAVLERLGGTRVFCQVAIRPGRPILFGTIPRKNAPDALFFALPGNPGASALTFDLLVRSAIRKMLGATRIRRNRVRATLASALTKPKGLEQLARGSCVVRDQSLIFEPASLQGSMSIRSLAGLGAVAFLPADATKVDAGAVIDVEMWSPL